MIKQIFLAAISVISTVGFSQELKPSQPRWYTGAECGVAAYQRSIRSECGVKNYVAKVSPACQVEAFNLGRDMSCPGSKSGGKVVYVHASKDSSGSITFSGRAPDDEIQGNESLGEIFRSAANLEAATWRRGEFNYWSCNGTRDTTTDDAGHFAFSTYWIKCVSKDYPAECRSPGFGVASYTSCEHPSHGVAQFNECEDPRVVAAYNTCLIRKTMPEVEAYIESTKASLQLLARQLAKAESDYLLNSKQVKLASCLIDRYDDDILYEDIVEELKNGYSAMFGDNYSKGQYDCSSSPERIRYTLNGSTCELFTDDEIMRTIQSQDLSPSENLFYKTCEAESNARSLRRWFQFHEYEISELLRDPVASSNDSIRADLTNLKSEISTSHELGGDCLDCNVKVIDLKTERTSRGAKI